MKIARTADTMHAKFQLPTVRPGGMSKSLDDGVPEMEHTCHPRIVKRRRVDGIDLWEALEEGRDSQETAHNTLRIAIAPVDVNMHEPLRSKFETYKKHNPQTALIVVVNLTPVRPRNLVIVR